MTPLKGKMQAKQKQKQKMQKKGTVRRTVLQGYLRGYLEGPPCVGIGKMTIVRTSPNVTHGTPVSTLTHNTGLRAREPLGRSGVRVRCAKVVTLGLRDVVSTGRVEVRAAALGAEGRR